jgi:hypothetical protein
LTPDQVLRDVEEFANEHGLEESLPLLRKGVLISRDPENYRSVPGMTEEDITAIENEVVHKWRQPWSLYFTIILCSIGAAVQYVLSYKSNALWEHAI